MNLVEEKRKKTNFQSKQAKDVQTCEKKKNLIKNI